MSALPLVATPVTSPPGSPPIPSKRRRTELSEQPELQCANPSKCHTAMDPNQSANHHHHDHSHSHSEAAPNASCPSTALREAVRAIQQNSELSDAERAERIHNLFAETRQRHINRDAPPATEDAGHFPGKGAARGCEHYGRKCWIRAKCCGNYYACRRCHDEKEDHEIDRHATEEIGCVECGDHNQPVARHCRTCNVEFARYFCGKCKFFDDTEGKEIYHCDGCGICRVGKGLGIDQHHCNGCGNCVPIEHSSPDAHPCRERSLDANCPICTHYLATSTEPVVFMRCGHTMHTECLSQHTASRYTCPICNKCLTDMNEWYRALDERIAKDVIPPEYANRVSKVLCHDCGKKTVVGFHFVYHKCGCCGGYNTRILQQFDVEGGNDPRILAQMNRGGGGGGLVGGGVVHASGMGNPLAVGARDQHPQLEEAT